MSGTKKAASASVQRVRLDVNHMMTDTMGMRYGIAPEQVQDYAKAAAAAHAAVQSARGVGWLGWTELPYNQEEIVARVEKA
ncbi:MAG: hypothetical protein FWE77_01200, partial [Clostridia bacterium]|nr:hypothetical protein [Clostridia bacterium]